MWPFVASQRVDFADLLHLTLEILLMSVFTSYSQRRRDIEQFKHVVPRAKLKYSHDKFPHQAQICQRGGENFSTSVMSLCVSWCHPRHGDPCAAGTSASGGDCKCSTITAIAEEWIIFPPTARGKTAAAAGHLHKKCRKFATRRSSRRTSPIRKPLWSG